MTQVSYYQPKRGAPGALAMVIALHAAGIAGLMMWKIAVPLTEEGTMIAYPVPLSDPIPPEPAKKVDVQQPVVQKIASVPPVVEVPLNTSPPVEVTNVPAPPVWFPPPNAIGEAPVPPQPPRMEAAKARGDVRRLFTAEDYPAAAIRRDETGSARARLAIGTDGKVTGCSIVQSTGSSALDQATCRILKDRARFTPAKDASGRLTSDSYLTPTISWQLVDQG